MLSIFVTAETIKEELSKHAQHLIKIQKVPYKLYKEQIQCIMDCTEFAEKSFKEKAMPVLKELQGTNYYNEQREE